MNNAWTSDDAKGFIKILGNAQNIFSSLIKHTVINAFYFSENH
jgi:argininosuccinate synthase